MKLKWIIGKKDTDKIKNLIDKHSSNTFVQKRVSRNIKIKKININKEVFWKEVICSLLTTQQQSGAGSKPDKFYNKKPFPLSLKSCKVKENNLYSFIEENIKGQGFRYENNKTKYIVENYNRLTSEKWELIVKLAKKLIENRKKNPSSCNINIEKEAAKYINDSLIGFGPKQSRNLWQSLGLFRYEIPIDSRVTKWLNKHSIFPFNLTAGGLSDINYYQFIMEGIQKLCKECDVLPCRLDAVIFVSYDK